MLGDVCQPEIAQPAPPQKASRVNNSVTIRLAGTPHGKGRARFVRATGHAFTPAKTRSYEAALRVAAGEAMAGQAPFDGPVSVVVTALFPIPQSWSQKKQLAAARGEIRPIMRGGFDADNILKSLDSFNEIVFRDDAQIV
jgi:Holliday junction resolvase RusA-like endonuclease